ncbi:GNAT family N-acetyltransferase [Aneurinibacillus aneurinilyticus]|uniref:GNAT family N-acetyltransferase n=1 Tax=Aneurinibacillus aneurinilyticus TaxID=1391 RepID=UPI00399D321E
MDARYRGQGYGQELMDEVFDICQEIARLSGCVFLTLEALKCGGLLCCIAERIQKRRNHRNIWR